MVELKILELYRNCKRKTKADNVTAWLVPDLMLWKHKLKKKDY
jgi:hypothetical protein